MTARIWRCYCPLATMDIYVDEKPLGCFMPSLRRRRDVLVLAHLTGLVQLKDYHGQTLGYAFAKGREFMTAQNFSA